jgi:hypothetical protein
LHPFYHNLVSNLKPIFNNPERTYLFAHLYLPDLHSIRSIDNAYLITGLQLIYCTLRHEECALSISDGHPNTDKLART